MYIHNPNYSFDTQKKNRNYSTFTHGSGHYKQINANNLII